MITAIRVLLLTVLSATAVAAETPEQLIKAGHWKRARVLIQAAYAQNPKDPHATVLMARLKRMWGDLEGARKLLEQVIASDPNNFDAHFALSDVLGEQASKASVFRQMSLAGSLRHEIETAVQLKPTDVDAHWGMMQYYMQAPGIAGGSKEKARGEVAAIAKISPSWGYLAEIEFDQHEKLTVNLEDLFHKAREADPQNYNAIVSFCNFVLNQKRWEEAEKCASDLLKLDRGRVSGYSVLTVAYVNQKKWSELDAAITDGEKNVPDNLTPYFVAGRILADSGADNARGERYLRHYLEQEPEPNASKPSRAHWRLGQILEKAGRKNDALAEYSTATRLEPEFEPAQKDLKRLQ